MTRALPAVAAIVLLASACGGAENEPSLAAAAERTEATGSSAFALEVVQSFGHRSETYACEGAADFAAKRMRLRCGDEGEFIAVGDAYYARAGLYPSADPDRPWVRLPTDQDDGLSPYHSFAPDELLTKLRAASVETAREGSEDVRGVATVRYAMTVPCDEVDLDCPEATTTVVVWIDDEGLVRRLALADGRADVTAEYFDFGIRVDVHQPPPSAVSDPANPVLGPCAGGGEPISAPRLRRALERHGFTRVSVDRDECPPGSAARVLAVEGNPTQGSIILCFVQERAGTGAPSSVEEVSSFGIEALRLRNVHCTPYGGSTDRLRDALDEIARELGP